MCDSGCMFCPSCVKRGAEVQIGENKIHFSCLLTCGATLPLKSLQGVLSKNDAQLRNESLCDKSFVHYLVTSFMSRHTYSSFILLGSAWLEISTGAIWHSWTRGEERILLDPSTRWP